MKEETYLKAKAIMDRVEELRELKEFKYIFMPECYCICFATNTGTEKMIGVNEIGSEGIIEIIDTCAQIIDNLISEQLKKLDEIKETDGD